MKAKIEQVNSYKVTIGDETFDGLEKVGEWEDMVKFIGPQGIIIVDSANDNGFGATFNKIVESDNSEPIELDIVKASPGMIAAAINGKD